MSKMWLLMKPLSKEDVSKRDEEEKGTPTPPPEIRYVSSGRRRQQSDDHDKIPDSGIGLNQTTPKYDRNELCAYGSQANTR